MGHAAAQSQGLAVQATQIPGVAQRTGATTYYLEVMPSRAAQPSVLALNPAIGEVDVALATELLEAGRMIFNGFVTPDRTTLIASTHRVYAIAEKSAPLGARTALHSAHMAREFGDEKAIERLRPDLSALMSTADGAEGLQSFIERRDAVFTGH